MADGLAGASRPPRGGRQGRKGAAACAAGGAALHPVSPVIQLYSTQIEEHIYQIWFTPLFAEGLSGVT